MCVDCSLAFEIFHRKDAKNAKNREGRRVSLRGSSRSSHLCGEKFQTPNGIRYEQLSLQQRWIFFWWKSKGMVLSVISRIEQSGKSSSSKTNRREFVLKKMTPPSARS